MASEEDYVSQLTVLRGEFQQQMMIAACSLKPYLSLEQCMDIFRNRLVTSRYVEVIIMLYSFKC